MKPLSRVVPPSLTMSLDQNAKRLSAEGRDIINLTAGQVDLPMPPEGKAAILAALEADRTGYVPAAGSADLKEAVRNRKGWTDGSILISAGAKPLLNAAVACVLGAGDEALLPVPCYTSYPEMIRLSGATPVPVPCRPENGFCVTPDDLLAGLTPRTKALILNHPTNPTGAVYSRDTLKGIVDLCIARDLWILADEVYGAFVYEGVFTSLYDFPEIRDRLILVDSASKTYAMAGLRLGYAVAPDAAAQAMAGYLSHAIGCPCSLSERAALAVLSVGDRYPTTLRDVFHARRDRMREALSNLPGIRVEGGSGAFYLWLDVTGIDSDDMRFCRRLLTEQGVALTPGSAFSAPGFVRLAFTKDVSLLSEAANRIRRFCGE